jgi:hypothetical protein
LRAIGQVVVDDLELDRPDEQPWLADCAPWKSLASALEYAYV